MHSCTIHKYKMKEKLNRLPKEILGLIHLARDVACDRNEQAYLVGGFVRDLLLGRKNFDLDIVVEGDGIKFAENLANCLKAKLIRHRRFGTATIISILHRKIDMSSARKEIYPKPGHLPVVSPGTLREDLFRRDFSINAMAISISCENFGKLIDLFGGKADLKSGLVRVLHNLSFRDDPTRILRAIRFEKRYDFKIHTQTLKLLKAAVKANLLQKVEPQRIRDDLILMLKEESPLKVIMRLDELAGFSFLDPGLSISKKIRDLLRSIEKQIRWFKDSHSLRRAIDSWLIYFMGILSDMGIAKTKSICRRLALRFGEEKRILASKQASRKFILRLANPDTKPSGIYSLLEPLSYEAIILLKSKYKNHFIQKHISDFFQHYNGARIHIRGEDLHNQGILPGPHYQKIFQRVLHAKLNGLVKTKDDELGLVNKIVKDRH